MDGFVPCEGGAEGSISWTGEKGRANGAGIGDDESVVSEGGDFRELLDSQTDPCQFSPYRTALQPSLRGPK